MPVVLRISARNLWRQKRRNALLGAAIALGVMILVLAHGFANGITDILLNKIVIRVAGHISVAFNERGKMYRQVFRDRERMLAAVRESIQGVREIEEAVAIYTRVVGNGRADGLISVGIDLGQQVSEATRREIAESFRMLVGDFADLGTVAVENPVILSEEKAKFLNVGKDDILRMRFTNIYGNDDTARATVVGIVRNDNVFMQAVMFMELGRLKRLLGYRPHELANLNITLEKPRQNAVRYADLIHDRLRPGTAAILGEAAFQGRAGEAGLVGLRSGSEARKRVGELLPIVQGPPEAYLAKDVVAVDETLAAALGLGPGDRFELAYRPKFGTERSVVPLTVSALFRAPGGAGRNLVVMGEEAFYPIFYDNLPAASEAGAGRAVRLPGGDEPLGRLLSPEWELLERTTSTEALQKRLRDINRGTWKGTTIDVRTMYESASDVLKLENVLNLITLSAVFVLFVIILIGIVNTMRMAIRERTREIGTVRAVGMQRAEVRGIFLLEALLLALTASAVGTLAAFGAMHLLAQPTFQMRDNPLSILLVSGHLYFKPTWAGVAGYFLLIQAIVAATAFFPARRAANLSPSDALRR